MAVISRNQLKFPITDLIKQAYLSNLSNSNRILADKLVLTPILDMVAPALVCPLAVKRI